MIDGLNKIVGKCAAAIRTAHQADVALGAPVQESLLINLVVHPDEPRVFVDCCRGRACEQIGGGQAIAGLILESPIWIKMDRVAATDGTSGCAPREGLKDGAQLRRGS